MSLKIDGNLVFGQFLRVAGDFGYLFFSEHDGEYAILDTVVGEDVRERRCDDGPEAKILQRPDRMFARRATTKIPSRQQYTRAGVTGLVERKRRVELAIGRAAPIVKQKLTKASTLNSLQKLLGTDLVGIDIRALER